MSNNDDMVAYRNGVAGEKWRDEAADLDQLLAPFADSIVAALPAGLHGNVLDVGCGSGALSLKLANAYGGVRVTGVDVSKPMLGLARERAEKIGAKATFIETDASTYESQERHTALFSRFGVMFFADPVAAFAHLRKQMVENAPLCFACWHPAAENEWIMAPMKAAMQFMNGPLPSTDPRSPGPFAFAEADYVREILEKAGWHNIDTQAWDGSIRMPGATIEDSAEFSLTIGPLARLIAEQNIDRSALKAALVEQFQDKVNDDDTVRLAAAAWIVTARA